MCADIGVALFGLGRAGSIHIQNIVRHPRLNLLYIVDLNVREAERRAKNLDIGDVPVIEAGSLEPFEDERVRAIIVCSRTETHEELVSLGIKYQKAIFCEKPISYSSASIRKLYDDAHEAGVPLFCAFNRRFDPSIKKLRERVATGELGKILSIKTCSRDHLSPSADYFSTSGGIFQDSAVHDIDVVCWLTNQRPGTVYAVGSAICEETKVRGDVDSAMITMKFPDGCLASIDLCRLSKYGYDQRFEVYGVDGMLISDQRPTDLTCYNSSGTSKDPLFNSFPERYRESYIQSLDRFVDVLGGDKTALVSKFDSLAVSIIAQSCEESLKSGHPVTLSWD